MFTAIFTFLAGPVFGSIVGAVGGYFNRRLDIDLRKHEIAEKAQDRAHELQLREFDIKVAQAEADGRARVAVVEGTATIEAERMRTTAAAFVADKGPDDWVDRMRRSVRPLLTFILVAGALLVNGVMLWRLGMAWPDLSTDARTQLVVGGVSWIGTQASAVIAFWFVSRPSEFPK